MKLNVPRAEQSEPTEVLIHPYPFGQRISSCAMCEPCLLVVLGVLRRLAPKLTKEMGMLPTTFGNLMLTLGGLQTLAFVILGTGYSTRWHYRFAPILVVQLLSILSFLGIWGTQTHTSGHCVWDYGCVGSFYLFQQPLLRVGSTCGQGKQKPGGTKPYSV